MRQSNFLETPCPLVRERFPAGQLQVHVLSRSPARWRPTAVLGQGDYQVLHIHAVSRLLGLLNPMFSDIYTFPQMLSPQYNRQYPKRLYPFGATPFLVRNVSPCLFLNLPEETDYTDSDIQIEDPLFIRKLRFIPLQSCPRAPTQMLIG